MARVILHIGQSKTGTTAIQHFLAANRNRLRQAGILYPDICKRGVGLGAINHNLVAWALIGKKSRISVPINDFMSGVETELARDARIHTVILSAEAFMGEPHIWDFDSVDDWRAANTAKLATLRKLLSGHDVTVFAYLRRQDYWVNSAFNHNVKTEGLIGRQLYPDIHTFIESISPRLDYAEELDAWAQIFGKEAISAHPYEKAQLKGGDAVTDFCTRIGLKEVVAGFIRPRAGEAANLGLPRDVFELKRILNRVPKSKSEERVLIWILQAIGPYIQSQNPEWDFLLSSAERRSLLLRFETCNARLARQFTKDGSATFFSDPLPLCDAARDYPGLSLEKAAELFFRVCDMRKSWAAKRLFIRYAAGDLLRRRFLRLYWLIRPLYRLVSR